MIHPLYFIFYLPGLSDNSAFLLENLVPALVYSSLLSFTFIISKIKINEVRFSIFLLSISSLSFATTKNIYLENFKLKKDNKTLQTLNNLTSANKFLFRNKISRNEKITFLNFYGNNLSLYYLKRDGYASNRIMPQDFVAT